ncbi:hypothetical protein C8J56DRAFT_142781 [Mycena floridula]|nr:hypothetical protein C8J56DRAFT_142781 [Mycena floridula]
MSDSITDSPSPNLTLERSMYWGLLVMVGLYSIEIFMFCYSTYLLVQSTTLSSRAVRTYIVFGAVILALTTVTVFTNAVMSEFMWIDHRDAPGGPLGYAAVATSFWWQVLGTGTVLLTNSLGDALLVYRCYIIYNGRWSIIAFPCILWLSCNAMAIIMLYQSARPGSSFLHGQTVNFGVPWTSLTVALNTIVAGLIIFRIVQARRSNRKHFGDRTSSIDTYTSVIAILVESTLPFAILGLCFAVTFGMNWDVCAAFIYIFGAFCALTPQFIIFRVASGNAWTRGIASDISARISTFKGAHTESSTTYAMSTIIGVSSTSDSATDFKVGRSVASLNNKV